MPLTIDQLDDFVTLTLDSFKRHAWTDLSLPYQHYVSHRFFQKRTVKEKPGPYLSWRIQTKHEGNARNTGPYAQDVTNVDDVMTKAQIPWRIQTTNFSYSVFEEEFQSDNADVIVNELKVREHSALVAMAELNENNLWTAPTSPTDNRPHGLPYWMVKNPLNGAGNPDEGSFSGGNPSGHPAGVAGLDSTTNAQWRNWTFGYKAVTREDLVRKVKKALRFTHFMPPVASPNLNMGAADHQIFTTERVLEPLEALAESRNDNLGPDVARYMNQVTIGGCSVEWVPWLQENDTTDPLYGINWQVFRPFAKSGMQMKRHKPKQAAHQHDVREVHIDNVGNYECTNRRALWVGSLAS